MARCHAYLLATLLMVAATLAQSNESTYHDCSTNFTTLERALVQTSDNRFRILSAFYPSREGVSLYIDVTYNFSCTNETDHCIQKWIWTCGTFYLIQPPEVFQFTSLLFVFPRGRIKKLDINLPEDCRNVSTVRSTHSTEGMLEILTQRLRLYAQYNDLQTIVATDENPFLAKAIPTSDLTKIYGMNGLKHGHYPIAIFFSLTLTLPILSILTMILVMKSCRVQIRLKLTDPKFHPTFASLIIIGLWFSIYVVVMDIFATVAANQKINGEEDEHGNNLANGMIYGTFVIDFVVTLYGLYCLCICCPSLHGDTRNDKDCFRYYFCLTFCGKTVTGIQERMMWWLATTTVAPIVSFTGHIGYMILGWIANPSHGGAVFIIYTVTFFYLYTIFKQIYHVPEDKYVTKATDDKGTGTELVTPVEEDEHHQIRNAPKYSDNTFSFCGLITAFVFGIPILGFHAYIIVAFGTLPIVGVIEDTPTYLLSLFQISVLVASVVLTYKYLTAEPPVERDLLRNIVNNFKYYKTTKQERNQNQNQNQNQNKNKERSRQATEVEKAAAIFGILMYNNMITEADSCERATVSDLGFITTQQETEQVTPVTTGNSGDSGDSR